MSLWNAGRSVLAIALAAMVADASTGAAQDRVKRNKLAPIADRSARVDPPAKAGAGGGSRPTAGGLMIAKACSHKLSYRDKGSGADLDLAMYQPNPPSGYLMIGGYAQQSYGPAYGCVTVVREAAGGSSGRGPLLAPPSDWKLVWTSKGSGADKDGSIWHGVPPSRDYACIGSVATGGYSKPRIRNYVCVHTCLVETYPVAKPIWTDKGSRSKDQVSLFNLPNGNTFYATPGRNSPGKLQDLGNRTACGSP